jgi:hypothetical protein
MSPEEVVIAWNDLYSRPDVLGCLKYMSDDFTRVVDSPNFKVIDRKRWAEGQIGFFPAFPDWSWKMQSINSFGNIVAVEFEEHGTFTLPYTTLVGSVIQPTGQSYTDHCGLLFKVNDDGLICELHPYYTNDLHRKFHFTDQIIEYVIANNVDMSGW